MINLAKKVDGIAGYFCRPIEGRRYLVGLGQLGWVRLELFTTASTNPRYVSLRVPILRVNQS